MKRTNTYILAPLALLLGLAACTREDSGILPDGTQPLTLTASIEGSTTMRSTVNNSWDGGETIALQVNGDEWYEYTVDASGNMSGNYYWQQSNSSITVQGLYPATAVEEDEENLTWSVASDQSGDASYQSADLLASDLQTVSYGSTANLAFYHQTAKVRVNVKAEGLPTVIEAAATDISLTLGDDNLVLDGTFSLPTAADDNGHWFGAWEPGTTSGTTKGSITPHIGTAATGCIATYEALVIPQTVASGTQLLTLTLTKDDTPYGPFLYTLPTATEWRAGHVYTYNLRISSTLEVSVSSGLVWSDGTEGNGEVTMPPDYEISGTTYTVYTAAGLTYVAGLVNNGATSINITLAKDIDLTGIEWTPVGNSYNNRYTGTFEGGGFTITGLTFNDNRTDCAGLIGNLGSRGGKVQNLKLDNVNITGNRSVGGVVAYNYGTVTACSVSGSVFGSWYVGGVVGYNSYGTVTACYASCSVEGTNYVGGVVGENYAGTVTACYHALGSVSGTNYVGGVVGRNYSGIVNACYWSSNIDTGIGYDYGSGSATFVDGSGTTWQDAVSAMNTALGTPREWEYELIDGNDLPTLTKKSEE